MCSASNRQKPTDDEPHGEDGTESGDDMGSTSGGHSRDPNTGEGMWIDDEDEPLVLEKPKKIQKFCGKVLSDKMDKSITVAVPYWYYVKVLGKKIIRHSKIMAHDEENSCRIGDKVIIVDCKRRSKRKAHTLLQIVHKLPRLDDPS
ncbi:unnamed protein product [Ascophyllum nodosum]